jgi:hypothetical protein
MVIFHLNMTGERHDAGVLDSVYELHMPVNERPYRMGTASQALPSLKFILDVSLGANPRSVASQKHAN